MASSFHVTWLMVALLAMTRAGAANSAQTPAATDDVVIKLERTTCFGPCQVYSVTIDATGNVTYEGVKFVRVEGRQNARISPSRVAALLETAERIGFFGLQDQYRTIRNPDGTVTIVSDLPTTFVTITRGGRSKRVENYLGAPAALKELEQQIDEAAGSTRWR